MHSSDAAKVRPAFQKMRFPSHQLADQVAHAIVMQISVVFSMIFRMRFSSDFGLFLDPLWINFRLKVRPKRLRKSMKKPTPKNYRKLMQNH